jgi:hypothetical protein
VSETAQQKWKGMSIQDRYSLIEHTTLDPIVATCPWDGLIEAECREIERLLAEKEEP